MRILFEEVLSKTQIRQDTTNDTVNKMAMVRSYDIEKSKVSRR
jgi:hypothetical protein